MINTANEIVELINFIRPKSDKIKEDKIFSDTQIHYQMKLKEGGIDYLKKMLNGYVSHYRGLNPFLFANVIEKGKLTDKLLFTHIVRCKMEKFQLETYKIAALIEDALSSQILAVSNFVVPILDDNKKTIIGTYGSRGLLKLKNQLESNYDMVQKQIKDYFKFNETGTMIQYDNNSKIILGNILKFENIKNFSTKIYKLLKNLSKNVIDKKGPKTSFIYSNLVKFGVNLLRNILIINGYITTNKQKILDYKWYNNLKNNQIL